MNGEESTTQTVALDIEFANRKIWLVKVPNFVAERWREVCASHGEDDEPAGPGPELGHLTWEAGTSGEEDAKMQLTLTHPSTESLPKSYPMNVATQNMSGMLGFTETGPRSIGVVGRISQKFDAEVSRNTRGRGAVSLIDPEYRKLSRQRAQQAAKKTRTTQLISQPQITNLRQPVEIGLRKKREHWPQQIKQDPSEKRLAKPAEELTADLFRLFERQPHWAFSQLQRQTDQPSQHLKTVLMEIAIQNKRGPYKDMWELKKGYRLSGES